MSAPRAALSHSVTGLLQETKDQNVTARVLVNRLFENHRHYGAGRAGTTQVDEPEGAAARAAGDWLSEILELYDPLATPLIDGRRVVLGLALLDGSLRQELKADGLFDELTDEVEKFEASLSSSGRALLAGRDDSEAPAAEDPAASESGEPAATPPAAFVWPASARVPTLSDQPTEIDLLNREAFADALAATLDGVRSLESEWRPQKSWFRRRTRVAADSFMLHVEGAWGSGKSSLLNFLSRALKELPSRWVVVRFNAWQHQRAGVPWWLLMTALLKEGIADPWRRDGRQTRRPWSTLLDLYRSAKLAVLDFSWRIRLGWIAYLVLPAGIVLVWYLSKQGAFGVRSWEERIKLLAAGAGLLITALSGARGLSRSLSVSSARGAETFVAQTRDPMNVLRRRYNRMVRTTRRPIAILIDDLDRCRAEYVVELLEGIQTLLRDAPVRYVVAADRRWLYDCFESVYQDLGKSAQNPGRPLRHLFLEKAFQLSTSVPRLAPEETEQFLYRLTQGPVDLEERDRAAEDAVREFAVLETEADIHGALTDEPDDPLRKQARRAAAVRRLAEADLELTTEYTIKGFAHLNEPNPRALKRLLIAYRLERALQILEQHGVSDLEQASERLVLWTILRLRWPLLAEYIARHPDAIVDIKRKTPPPELADMPLGTLFDDEDVQKVIAGTAVGGALDVETVKILAGRR